MRELTNNGPAAVLPVPDLEEAVIQVGGQSWTVRVLGRSGGGASGVTAPLLLLGFWDRSGSGHGHAREAFVVGQTLAGLPAQRLEVAFARSRPAPL